MQHNYEAELDEACQLLGYISYKHFYDTEKSDMSPDTHSNPHTMQNTWKWLLNKINMHPHFDFSDFIYPLTYARHGVRFRVCNVHDLYDSKVELHTIITNPKGPRLEQMSWLAHNPQGATNLEDKMGEYMSQQEDDKTTVRFWDYTIASAYALSNTVKSMNNGKVPLLYII